MKTNNLILRSDSYKYSHPFLYPPDTEYTFFYIEPRGGEYDFVVFAGLQYYLKEYLLTPITQKDIDEAEILLKKHGVPFYREGWEHILNVHKGYLPLKIRAVPEGSVIPTHNVLMTVENTDPKCFWLTGFIETLLLKIWYPITVASRSYKIRQIILEALHKSSDDPEAEIDFKMNAFGYRGNSSEESAGIGGFAESLSFKGTDTLNGIVFARDYYGCDMSGFSIPAYEHSVMCSWGKENEAEAYKHGLKTFAKSGTLLACVSDTYDLWNCIENIWNKELKEQVINSGAKIIIRPDSGIPHEVVLKTVELLDKGYGHTLNSKGFKVLNNVAVIQGDGINEHSVSQILDVLLANNWSATNIAFGMGGGMIQQLDRDTCKFAMKLSAVSRNGVWYDVCKDPITDPGKKSKAGKIDLVFRNGKYQTINGYQNDSFMRTIFENGKLLINDNLDLIRSRVKG